MAPQENHRMVLSWLSILSLSTIVSTILVLRVLSRDAAALFKTKTASKLWNPGKRFYNLILLYVILNGEVG